LTGAIVERVAFAHLLATRQVRPLRENASQHQHIVFADQTVPILWLQLAQRPLSSTKRLIVFSASGMVFVKARGGFPLLLLSLQFTKPGILAPGN